MIWSAKNMSLPVIETRGNAAVAWQKGRSHAFYEDRFRMLVNGIPKVDASGFQILAVADGVSDALRGMNAAQFVCDRLLDFYSLDASINCKATMLDLLTEVNSEVASWGVDERGRPQGAAVASVVLIENMTAHVFQAGDTLPMLIRDEVHFPMSSKVSPSRALRDFYGRKEMVIDVRSWPLCEGDRIVLASDGITGVIPSNIIGKIAIEAEDSRATVIALSQRASRITWDDVTVLALDIFRDD
jgi:serine/threonine protein phosphatase PrpC